MRLINTTSSHSELVRNQLRNTDAKLVETYSAGNTDVVFTKAPSHYELLISNKYRAIKESEIEAIREFFLKRKIDKSTVQLDQLKTLHTANLIEISLAVRSTRRQRSQTSPSACATVKATPSKATASAGAASSVTVNCDTINN